MTIPTYMTAVPNSQRYDFARGPSLLYHSRLGERIYPLSLENVRSKTFEHRA